MQHVRRASNNLHIYRQSAHVQFGVHDRPFSKIAWYKNLYASADEYFIIESINQWTNQLNNNNVLQLSTQQQILRPGG